MSALQCIGSRPTGILPVGRIGPLRPRRLNDVRTVGECPRQSVLALLEEHTQHHPLNRALVMLGGERACAVTYVQLARRVREVTAWLSARFPEGGECIAMLSKSSPAWGIVALATMASRNVLVPLDSSMEPAALGAIVRRVRPAILFTSRACYGSTREMAGGGAPLADEIADFFDAVGTPVIQGYGLTETSPVVATNTVAGSRRGSVGRPLSGTETAISDCGEILVRGPQVAGRYRLDSGAGESVADTEGWFHTGDLGHVDADGFLYVIGRTKTADVLASGKNVQPEEIETRPDS
jgi:long-subunit acyl-CoA synthetase (AMP-forming)